jgi:hypothetical protein
MDKLSGLIREDIWRKRLILPYKDHLRFNSLFYMDGSC